MKKLLLLVMCFITALLFMQTSTYAAVELPDDNFGGGHRCVYNVLKYNDKGHWEACACGKKKDSTIIEHEFTKYYKTDEEHWHECDECGYIADREAHSAYRYQEGEDGHWVVCICGLEIEKAEHKYDNDCDTSCNDCLAVREVEPHDYADATCSAPKTCKVCYATEGSKLGHNSDAGTVTKKATCSAAGTKTYKCTRCSETIKTETVAKLAHDYSKATCTKAKTCKVCKSTSGKALGHSYSAATCTKAKTCKVCKSTSGKALGHKYTNVVKAATTSKNGTITKKCSVCSKVADTSTIYSAKTVKLSGTSYTYNGKTKTPAVTVKDSKGKTISSKYYTVKYATVRKNVGKYKVTVTFKGKYSGTKTLYFEIKPRAASINKLTAKTKAISVKLNRSLKQSTGYQIQYSSSKSFKSYKTVTVSSYKTSTATIKKLKAKTTYYVRVRTYKTIGKTKYYSNWSSYKSAKTK